MRIQHNIMAMSAYRNYTNNVAAMKQNLEKLSSGYKINRAGDDAAGLAISEKMRAQITGLETAQKNAKDGISLVQTAEGALTEVHDMLNRMVELATQSANGTYDDTTDRAQLQKEMDQLRSEINRIADSSNFNGIKLLDGSMSEDLTQIGTTSDFDAGTQAVTEFVAVASASTPLTWTSNTNTKVFASATIGKVPATDVMHLHSGGGEAQVGTFTIDLGGLSVAASSSGSKASFKLKLANGNGAVATATITAATNGADITNADIADTLASMVLVVNSNGTAAFQAASATVDKGSLVYTISKGSGDNANRLTFTAAAVAATDAAASAILASNAGSSTAVKITDAASIPTTLASAQEIDFNMTVSFASASNGTMSGFQQVGVTEYTNMKKAGGGQLGQAVVKLDDSKIKDGMSIKVGTGSNTKEVVLRLQGTAAAGELDLTEIVNASTASGKKAEVAQAIANYFKDADLGGVEIGVDKDNNLVVAEKDKGGNVSGATKEVQDAMSSYTSFTQLVQFGNQQVTEAEDKGSVKLNIDSSRLASGTTLTLTDAAGNVAKYTITNDAKKTGTDANGATYVQMGSDVATALKNAIGSNAAVASDGKTVTVTYELAGGTAESAVKAKAEVAGKKLTLQIGDTAEEFNQLKVNINDCHTSSLGISSISIADQASAQAAVDKIKEAINYVSDVRGTLGATQNRLDHTINNLSVMTENIQDAESTIRDTDVAEEMMAYTKNNILIQSAQAMLAQANQVPQGVLQLLQ